MFILVCPLRGLQQEAISSLTAADNDLGLDPDRTPGLFQVQRDSY